jgi:fructose-1-phosphate kinase PfkB-like protein
VGRHCEALLRQADRLDPLVEPVESPTRVILTVRTEGTDEQTAFFDPDPTITAQEAEALFHRIEGVFLAEDVELLTLSGSSPAPATHQLYPDLIALARSRKVPVFLDTYGPALDAVWGFWPVLMQLNRREAAGYLAVERPTDEDIFGLLQRWHRHGVQVGLVTDGERPVLAQVRGEPYVVRPPEIRPVNPIGSGDCLLAGLADGWLKGLEPPVLLRHGIACAVANALVWDAGAIDPETVLRLEEDGSIAVEAVPRAADGEPRRPLLRRVVAGHKR